MLRSNSEIEKPQRWHSKRTELPDVNINTGVQSSNTEKASFKRISSFSPIYSIKYMVQFLALSLE